VGGFAVAGFDDTVLARGVHRFSKQHPAIFQAD